MKKGDETKKFSFAVNDEQFTKSSFSQPGGIITRCVKIAITKKGVAVRDSKNDGEAGQSTLFFKPGEWKAFVKGVKNGEFD